MLRIKTLIVDDEKAPRELLEDLLTEYCPEIEIAGSADNVAAARNLLDKVNVDVVFLDIHMPAGEGFELLSGTENRPFKVVFVTGYQEYAIRAIRLNALDYLLKPVRVPELMETVDRLKKTLLDRTPASVEAYGGAIDRFVRQLRPGGQPEFITLKDTNGFDVIRIKDIVYLKGERNYTTIITEKGKPTMASKTLKHFESILPTNAFVRIHKSFLVNVFHIRRYHFDQSGYVLLSNGSKLDVSRRRYPVLLECVEGFSSL